MNRRRWFVMGLIFAAVAPASAYGQGVSWEQLMADATTAMQAGRLAEAEALFVKSVAEAERLLPDDPRLPQSLTALGGLYDELARFEEAEVLLKRALQARVRALGGGHPDVAATLASLARHYQRRGRP